MTLRSRMVAAAAGSAAASLIVAAIATYFVVSGTLLAGVDSSLRAQYAGARRLPVPGGPPVALRKLPKGSPGLLRRTHGLFQDNFLQLVSKTGKLVLPGGARSHLPVTSTALRLATADGPPVMTETTVGGVHIRLLVGHVRTGYAIEIARPLTQIDSSLAVLRVVLASVTAAGVLLALGLGFAVARTGLRPIRRLTHEVEGITFTGDPSGRVSVHSPDELGRLATTFNQMLAALHRSLLSQRQLVADASHEFRTPLTSIRTNLELLVGSHDLSPDERQKALSELLPQVEDLSKLVDDVVELARGEEAPHENELLRLDILVSDAVDRFHRHFPQVRFNLQTRKAEVTGDARLLNRAVGNLLENAVKWTPSGGEVDVFVGPGAVVVRDHGPGISPEDIPHVFERFYRSTASRGKPGSGLGLAIVRQVAETHGGDVTAENANGGGAIVRMRIRPASGAE